MIKLRMARCYRNPDWDGPSERATRTYTCTTLYGTLYVFLFPRDSRSFLATWIRIVSVSLRKRRSCNFNERYEGGRALPNYASSGRWLWLKPVYTVRGLTCSAPGNCGCAYCGRLVSQDENFPGAESSVAIDSSRCEWNCTKFQGNWPKKFHIIRVISVNFVSLISYSFPSFFFF